MNRILSILTLAGTLVPIESVSASIADTLNIYNDSIQLQSVEVRGERTRSALRRMDGMDIIGMQLMADMPKILGNADPLHYAQLMPGIQTNSEYDAGLHIQGCDNQHNVVALNGVPVYNPGHLLGIFSVFNGGHFANMQIRKSNVTSDSPNRIGGTVDMRSAGTMDEFGRGNGLHGDFFVRGAFIDRVFVIFDCKRRNAQRKHHTEGKQQSGEFLEILHHAASFSLTAAMVNTIVAALTFVTASDAETFAL